MTVHWPSAAAAADLPPLIVDSFAGGGGASTGIEAALGRAPDVAINHSAAALALHAANHPETLHLDSNIWDVQPAEVARGRRRRDGGAGQAASCAIGAGRAVRGGRSASANWSVGRNRQREENPQRRRSMSEAPKRKDMADWSGQVVARHILEQLEPRMFDRYLASKGAGVCHSHSF